MTRELAQNGEEYSHWTETAMKYFQAEAWSESAILRDEMDKLRNDLHHMDLNSNNNGKYLTTEVWFIKEDSVSDIYLHSWAYKMQDSISIISTKILERMQVLEGRTPQDRLTHWEDYKLQELEYILQEEIM